MFGWSTHVECQTDKFADNTAHIGQITDDDDRHYFQAFTDFVPWCDDNVLELNVEKATEMITDFRKNRTQPNSVVINWKENTNSMIKKVHSSLHCLRKLRSSDVTQILYRYSFALLLLAS